MGEQQTSDWSHSTEGEIPTGGVEDVLEAVAYDGEGNVARPEF